MNNIFRCSQPSLDLIVLLKHSSGLSAQHSAVGRWRWVRGRKAFTFSWETPELFQLEELKNEIPA